MEKPRFGEGCESKKSKFPGKARASRVCTKRYYVYEEILDVRGSQTPFARHDKHGSGDLDKLDIRG